MNIYHLVEWPTGCGLYDPAMAVSCQKGQGSGSCLVHKSGYLISSNLILEFWGMHRDLLVSVLHWNPEEVDSNTNRGIDELSSESRGKQAKLKTFPGPCPFMWATTRRYGPDLDGSSDPKWSQFKVGLLTSNNLTKKISHRYAQLLGLFWSRCGQVVKQVYHLAPQVFGCCFFYFLENILISL